MEQTFQTPSNPYASPMGQSTLDSGFASPKLTLSQVLFSFSGRIPRRTYWGSLLSVMACFYGLLFLIGAILGEPNEPTIGIILLVLYIPVLWMSFAIQAKRWHDRGKSGWWQLISLIPVIGPIWALIECGCLRGTEGSNRYGVDPT